MRAVARVVRNKSAARTLQQKHAHCHSMKLHTVLLSKIQLQTQNLDTGKHLCCLCMLRPTAVACYAMNLLLVRSNLVDASCNCVPCLFYPVPLTIISILGTLLDLLLVDLTLVFQSFALASGRLSVHGLLLQGVLVAWLTPLASFL